MSVVRLSDATLDAIADARKRGRIGTDPDTTYTPMGVMPPTLDCGEPARAIHVNDRHGNPHITACCLIHEARQEWHYAHPENLHVRQVPSRRSQSENDTDSPDLDYVPGVGMVLDAGELGGPPFAPQFADYLDAPHEPIIRNLRAYRVICAGRHRTKPDHRGRVVCGALLWATIANGNTIADAADALDMTPERATALLSDALRLVWAWRSRQLNGV